MDEKTKIVEFISFCIEMYAQEYNLSGADVADLFEKNGIINYLFDNYIGLHSQGKEYIIPLLHNFIKTREGHL